MGISKETISEWTKKDIKGDFAAEEKDKNKDIYNMYEYTKDFKDVSKYRLMRGVPDFGSLVQFNPFLTGYAAFIVCGIPKFMEELARYNSYYTKLIANWTHIIEYEFKSFDGIQDITTDTIQLGDDLNNLNVISRVQMQGSSEFSLTYDEKSGSPLTKFAKLYLTSIGDGRTQVKTYNGLIHSGKMEPGFEKEVFTFLFIVTDNTMREVEAAYLLIACQLTKADTGMYNYTKGDISKKEVTVTFNGYPIQSTQIDHAAEDMMKYLLSADAGARQIIVNSNNYNYTGADAIAKTLEGYGVNDYETYASINELKNNTAASYTTNNFFALSDQDTDGNF